MSLASQVSALSTRIGQECKALWAAVNGKVSAPRTDLWRTYDFLWQLHLMDWGMNENFNTPWMLAAAVLALSTVLFGVALLLHRFTRGLIRKETP